VPRPASLYAVAVEEDAGTHQDSSVVVDVETSELQALIDEERDVDLCASYLQMREGKSVPKQRREQVEAAIREILPDAMD
jgi:hypothetical protein